MRAPILLFGIAAPIVVPLSLRRFLEPAAITTLAWLLAISPPLVFYSRIVRSYLPVLILAFGAVLAFYRWHESQRRRFAVAYVALAALAIYVHPVAGPLVVAPFPFAALDLLARGEWTRRRAGALAGLAGLLGLALAAFLVPAWPSLWKLLSTKAGAGSLPKTRAIAEVVTGLAGSRSIALVTMFWLAVLRGLVVVARREPRFTLYALTLVVSHLAGLAVLAPTGLQVGGFFLRYALPLLPFLLAFGAAGLTAVGPGASRRRSTMQRLAVAGLLTGLVATGPLATDGYLATSFAHHFGLQSMRPPPSLAPEEIPAFYRELADGPRLRLIEFPWNSAWGLSEAVLVYQRVHGRRIIVSIPEPALYTAGFRFENLVAPDPVRFLETAARFVVVHRDVIAEDTRLHAGVRRLKKLRAAEWRRFAAQGPRMERRLRREWGAADYADGTISVWDLDRVRTAVAARGVGLGPPGPSQGPADSLPRRSSTVVATRAKPGGQVPGGSTLSKAAIAPVKHFSRVADLKLGRGS